MEDNKWSPLMEQNWKRMQIILDQELPVKNKKRRNVFAFLLLTGISIVFILLFRLADQNTKIKNAQNITKPVYAAKSFSGNTFINGPDTICDLGFENRNIPSTLVKSLSEGTKVTNKREKVNLGKSRLNSALTADQSEHKNEDSILKNTLAFDNFDPNTVHPMDNETNVNSNTLTAEKLANKSYFIVSNQKKALPFTAFNSFRVPQNDGWLYGFQGSLSFNTIALPQQYYAGIFASKSLGKVLVIEGQLGIKNFNRYSSFLRQNNVMDSNTNDLMGSSVSVASNVYNLDPKTLTNNTIDYVNESIIESTLSSAQYLESGLSVGFRINNQMVIKGGFSAGRFLHAVYNIDDSSRSIYTAFNKNQNLDNVDLTQASNLLKKWITNVFFEADFRVFKRWSLTSAILIGSGKNTLEYSNAAVSSLENTTNQSSILFKQPEKGTISIGVGAKYYIN